MRRFTAITAFAILLSTAICVWAQGSPAARKRAASAPRQRTAASGPRQLSRTTVDSFLRHVFGWDTALKITVQSIGPSDAPGLTAVKLQVQTPQGSGAQTIFVTPDEKHAILGALLPFSGAPGRPTDDAINTFVRSQTGSNPSITWTIAEVKPNALDTLTEVLVAINTPQGRGAQRFWVTADGKYAIVGDVSPFGADPYAPARAQLQRGINGPAKGPANAPVTIVEFADLQCPACKSAAPTVNKLLGDVPNARFVFQQFPLVQIHAWAYKAALIGDCVGRENNPGFWKFVEAVYSNQEQITGLLGAGDVKVVQPQVDSKVVPRLKELAEQSGAGANKVAGCLADPATVKRIEDSMKLGKEMEVNSTPTLFVNGRKISNVTQMPYDALKKLVQFMGTPAAK